MSTCIKGVRHGQIIVPYNGKIADITHADTDKHMLNLATVLSETRKIIGITIILVRVAGAGSLNLYPNEGVGSIQGVGDTRWEPFVIIANGTQRLQYALTVANDDWDLWCVGYVVEA